MDSPAEQEKGRHGIGLLELKNVPRYHTSRTRECVKNKCSPTERSKHELIGYAL